MPPLTRTGPNPLPPENEARTRLAQPNCVAEF